MVFLFLHLKDSIKHLKPIELTTLWIILYVKLSWFYASESILQSSSWPLQGNHASSDIWPWVTSLQLALVWCEMSKNYGEKWVQKPSIAAHLALHVKSVSGTTIFCGLSLFQTQIRKMMNLSFKLAPTADKWLPSLPLYWNLLFCLHICTINL